VRPRERFVAALRGLPVDRVPIFDWVNNPAIYVDALGVSSDRFDGALAARLSAALGLDACWAPDGGFLGLPQGRYHWLDDARYVDEWGVTWQVGEGSWPLAFPVGHAIRSPDDWTALRVPDPAEAWRSEIVVNALREARAGGENEVAVVAGIRGPFSSGWMLMGLEAMSYALADAPAMLDHLFRVTTDFWTAAGLRLIELGVDAVVVHDDQGSNTGTFFAPATFRRVVLPHLRRQIETLAATGAPVILHSCGNINAILPDLVTTGMAGLNNLQRSAGMDLAAVKREYGARLCLIGNVDASGVLVNGTAEEIEAAVRECLTIAAPGGRYILATDHSFHEGAPVDNVRAFVAAGRRWGQGQPGAQ
jgi:uroporphyrinogen decarboxylase